MCRRYVLSSPRPSNGESDKALELTRSDRVDGHICRFIIHLRPCAVEIGRDRTNTVLCSPGTIDMDGSDGDFFRANLADNST
jgi:hypothetical protein